MCVLLYAPGFVGRLECAPELFWSCLDGRVGRYGVLLGLMLGPDRTVVGLPHYSMVVWAPPPCHRIEGATYSWGGFCLGRQRILP